MYDPIKRLTCSYRDHMQKFMGHLFRLTDIMQRQLADDLRTLESGTFTNIKETQT